MEYEMFAYHVTPAENLPSIARDGLEPRCGERSEDLGETQSAIYLFREKHALEAALGSWLENAFDIDDPLACLIVDTDGLDIKESDAGFEVLLMETVSPDRIKLLSPDIWEEMEAPDIDTAVDLPTEENPQP
jgi:hypothetical protein